MAIQASRLSTYLHFCSVPGVLPHKMRQHWPNPCVTFFSSGKTNMCDMEYVAPKWPCTTSLYHCWSDANVLCPPGVNSRSARVLLMLVIPGHLVFLYAISLLQGKEAQISEAFVVCYLFAALLQVNQQVLCYICLLRKLFRLHRHPLNTAFTAAPAVVMQEWADDVIMG